MAFFAAPATASPRPRRCAGAPRWRISGARPSSVQELCRRRGDVSSAPAPSPGGGLASAPPSADGSAAAAFRQSGCASSRTANHSTTRQRSQEAVRADEDRQRFADSAGATGAACRLCRRAVRASSSQAVFDAESPGLPSMASSRTSRVAARRRGNFAADPPAGIMTPAVAIMLPRHRRHRGAAPVRNWVEIRRQRISHRAQAE